MLQSGNYGGPRNKIVLILIAIVLVFLIVDDDDDKVKVKFTPERDTKTQRGSRGIALLFL